MTKPKDKPKPVPVRIPPELVARIDALKDPLVPREPFVRDLIEKAVAVLEGKNPVTENDERARLTHLGEHAPTEAFDQLRRLVREATEQHPDMTAEEFADLVMGPEDDDEPEER
ncbi:MAG: hypothetical protein M3P44_08700 [Actinomycetota bacterium]|nr:hypothetical protein [Actinomycetota bacterium]